MIGIDVAAWLKAIRLPPRYLFGILVFVLLVLFFPDDMAKAFGIHEIREEYRGWIGSGAIGSFVFWLVQLWPKASQFVDIWRRRRYTIALLASLPPREREFLKECLDRNETTVYVRFNHPVALSFRSKGIFFAARGTGSMIEWPHSIPPYVWKHLQDNQQLVDPDAD